MEENVPFSDIDIITYDNIYQHDNYIPTLDMSVDYKMRLIDCIHQCDPYIDDDTYIYNYTLDGISIKVVTTHGHKVLSVEEHICNIDNDILVNRTYSYENNMVRIIIHHINRSFIYYLDLVTDKWYIAIPYILVISNHGIGPVIDDISDNSDIRDVCQYILDNRYSSNFVYYMYRYMCNNDLCIDDIEPINIYLYHYIVGYDTNRYDISNIIPDNDDPFKITSVTMSCKKEGHTISIYKDRITHISMHGEFDIDDVAYFYEVNNNGIHIYPHRNVHIMLVNIDAINCGMDIFDHIDEEIYIYTNGRP